MAACSFLTTDDLAPFADIDPAKAQAMIDDAWERAVLVAPCIADPDFAHQGAVRAILRQAILRWNDAGTGAIVQQSAGPFGQTVQHSDRRYLFWPSEQVDLERLCRDASAGGQSAFDIDTWRTCGPLHVDICALNLGALYCSCGAVLTQGYPLYETEGWL